MKLSSPRIVPVAEPWSRRFRRPDPAPLGLAAFAHHDLRLERAQRFVSDPGHRLVSGSAFFYGGARPAAGRACGSSAIGTSFGATAFSTYGGFWMALGFFVTLVLISSSVAKAVARRRELFNGLGVGSCWRSRSSTPTCCLWSTRRERRRLRRLPDAGDHRDPARDRLLQPRGTATRRGSLHAGGWARCRDRRGGAGTRRAAGVINGMSVRPVLPVGPLRSGSRLPIFSSPRGRRCRGGRRR